MRGLSFKKHTSWTIAAILCLQSFAFTLIPTSAFTSKHRHEVDPGFSAARGRTVESGAPNARYGCGEMDQQPKQDAEAQRKIVEADRLEKEAQKQQQDATATRNRASQRRELATAARKSADKALDPKDKQSWLNTAAQHEQEAQRLDSLAAQYEKMANENTAKAAQLRKEAAQTKPNQPSQPSPPIEPGTPENPNNQGNSGPKSEEMVPVEDLLGTWWTKGNETKITIEPLEKGSNRALKLKAKHDDWAGGYYDGTLVFHRRPKFDEMSEKAPEWARKEVENKLQWTLELKPESNCGENPTLKGNWFPGELQWSEEKDPTTGEIKRKAWVSETDKGIFVKGTPKPVEYTKGETSITLEFQDRADIVVWPYRDRSLADYYSPNPSLGSVSKTQPFTLVARMPIEMADRTGQTFPVSLRAANTGSSTTIELERYPGLSGTAIYSLPRPLRIADFGSGVDRINLKAENEDIVAVSAVNSNTVGFAVYNSPVQQGIAAQEEAFLTLLATYNVTILEAQDPKVREGAHRQMVLVNNARHLINDYHGTSLPALYVDLAGKTQRWDKMTDSTRLFIGKRYLALLEQKIDPRNEVDQLNGNKVTLSPEARDQFFRTLGITLTSVREWQELIQAFDEGERTYADSFWRDFVPQFSMGMYHVAVGTFDLLKPFNPVLSKIEDVTILIYGVDSLGEPVDKTQKIFAAIDLFLPLSIRAATYLSKFEAVNRAFSTPLRLRFLGAAGSISDKTSLIPVEINPNATFYASKAVKIERPLEEVRTLIQSRRDTCTLMALSAILRKAGFPRVGEEAMIGVASSIKVMIDGKLEPLYQLGKGTFVKGTPFLLAEWGIKSSVVPANLKAIEAALKKGMSVSVGAKGHALLIQKILRLDDGKKWVFFEDPWNGNLWRMLSDNFCQIYDESRVLIVDLSGKLPKKVSFMVPLD